MNALYLCASLTGVAAGGSYCWSPISPRWGVTTGSPASTMYWAEAQHSLLPQGLSTSDKERSECRAAWPGRQPQASSPDGELLAGAVC